MVIELLSDAISRGIFCLVLGFDFELMVLHLNKVYSVRTPTTLQIFLRVHLLEIYLYYTKYKHVSRCINTLTDALANYVLDRSLQHL